MNTETLSAALSPLGLESLLTQEDFDSIVQVAAIRRCGRGEVLWSAGTASRGLYIVLRGEVRVVSARDGRQHLVHVSGPGATMGEVPLFGSLPYPATAIVSRESECLVLPSDEIRALVQRNGAVASWFLHRLSQRVGNLVARLEGQTLGGVRMRLAASLIGLGAQSVAAVVTLPRPRTEWAEDLGTVREVLSRELRAFEAEGLVERLGPRSLRLVDERRLEEIALGAVRRNTDR